MTRLNVALGALLLAGTSTVAVAQSYPPGPYLGLKGGGTLLEDQDFKGRDGNPLNFTKETDIGFGVLGFGGYSFGWWRIEGELGYRRVENDQLRIGNDGGLPIAQGLAAAQTGTTQNANGSANAISVMGNVIYDLPFSFAGISPYIGAGLGMARIDADCRQPFCRQCMIKPYREWPCLEHDPLHLRGTFADHVRQKLRIRGALAAPDALAILPNRDRSVFQGNIETDILLHGCPPYDAWARCTS